MLRRAEVPAELYVDIGRHLDPSPNRRPGSTDDAVCRVCVGERERSERIYAGLLILLPPLLALPFVPAHPHPQLAAHETPSDSPPADGRGDPPQPRRRPRINRRLLAGGGVAAAVLLIVLVLLLVKPTGLPFIPDGLAGGARPQQTPAVTRESVLRDPCSLFTRQEIEQIVGDDVGPCEVQSRKMVPEMGGFTIGYLGTDTEVLIGIGDANPRAGDQLEELCRAGFDSNGRALGQGQRLPSADVGDTSCYSSGADGTWFALLASSKDIILSTAVSSPSPTLDPAKQLAKLAFGR